MTKEDLLKVIEQENSKMTWDGKWKAWRLSGQHEGFEYIIQRAVRSKEFDLKDTYTPIYLCGYVQIPKEHPLYKMDYDKIYSEYGLDAHGGLNFSGDDRTDDQEEWWIGFDCGHAYDVSAFSGHIGADYGDNKYRDLDYVLGEVKSLIKQIMEIKYEQKP